MNEKNTEPICADCKRKEKKKGKPLPNKFCSKGGEKLPVPPTCLERFVLMVRTLVGAFIGATLGFLALYLYLMFLSSARNDIAFAYVGGFFGMIIGAEMGGHQKKKPGEKAKPEGQAVK